MKITVAGRDRTQDLGREIKSAFDWRSRDPQFDWSFGVPKELSTLCLRNVKDTLEYQQELVRLMQHRYGVSACGYNIPHGSGPVGYLMKVFRETLWRVLRFMFDRITYRQNYINQLHANAFEFEHALTLRELGAFAGASTAWRRRS